MKGQEGIDQWMTATFYINRRAEGGVGKIGVLGSEIVRLVVEVKSVT